MSIKPRFKYVLARTVPGLLALTLLLAASSGNSPMAHATPRQGAAPIARTARTISVHETMSSHLVSHHGTTLLNEQGRGSGTFTCPLTVQVKLERSGATLSFTCSPSGGTLTGHGHTSFAEAGPVAYFKGTLALTRATGKFAHASVRNMHIEGHLRRSSYALSATVTGSMSL